MKLLKITFLLFILAVFMPAQAQAPSAAAKAERSKKPPAAFTISKSDIDKLFGLKAGEVLVNKKNKYLNKAVVVTNIQNGDTKFLRAQLPYFPSAFLTVQINGTYSTQVYILSEDKSLSYKSKAEEKNYRMSKCDEEEIISE